MLPGIRILFALVVLSFAILVFGFSALALLRTAHQNLASQPAWQQDWRTPVEIDNTRRDDRQAPTSETQTLALLRAEPSTAQPDTPRAQPAAHDAQDKKASVDAATDVSATSPAATSPSVADTNDSDNSSTVAPTADAAAPGEKTADQTTPPVLPADDPERVAASSDPSKVADLPNPPNDQVAPPATGPDTPATPAKASASESSHTIGDAAPGTAKAEPPIKVAVLPDTTAASNEAMQQAHQQSVKQSNAAELRSKRRARARLRARRLARARARAARLVQAQQTTNSPYYNSTFTTTGSSATSAAPNATPFGASRTP
jgi:hypothetical protein